jgi:xanthine/uracil permease
MIALGIATLMQSWGWRGIGSGYLLPACYSGIYFAPAVQAATSHGLGAVAGLTIIAGITQIILSKALRHFREVIPPDVSGICIFVIGLGWGTLGLKLLFGKSVGQIATDLGWVAGVVALASMVAASVWGSKSIRSTAVLIGLTVGCLTAALMYVAFKDKAVILPEQVFVWPRWPLSEITFEGHYVSGFMLGAVASFLRVAGDVIASHHVSDRNWKRPNKRSLAAGGLSEGLSNIFSGLLGMMPLNTNSGSVGLVAATNVSSRKIAWGVGVLWLVMGVLPFGAYLLLLIPDSVEGACVLFTTGFLMRSGIAMLTQRLIDNKRAIVIGFSLLVGLSFNDILTTLNVWPPIHAVFSSPLIASVSVAILLTALFRIGLKTTVSTVWTVDQGAPPLNEWIQAWSGVWAARSSVLFQAEAVLEEFAQAAPYLTHDPVDIQATYDEVSLRLEITWKGDAFMIEPDRERVWSIESDINHVSINLASALIRRVADHVSERGLPDGTRRLCVTIDDL